MKFTILKMLIVKMKELVVERGAGRNIKNVGLHGGGRDEG
jgi:hypothetical protein